MDGWPLFYAIAGLVVVLLIMLYLLLLLALGDTLPLL